MERQYSGHGFALCASLVLAGCSASQQGAPGQYAQSRDSATQASLSRPELAVHLYNRALKVEPARVQPHLGVY